MQTVVVQSISIITMIKEGHLQGLDSVSDLFIVF